MMSILCVEWRAPIMPARAYEYFHRACWESRAHSLSNAQVREVTTEIRATTTCSECGKPLVEEQPEQKEV